MVCWVMLMLAILNLHFDLGRPADAGRVRHGPPTEPQYAALVRLHTAADLLCELNPGKLEGVDWERELRKSRISHSGDEVLTAIPL